MTDFESYCSLVEQKAIDKNETFDLFNHLTGVWEHGKQEDKFKDMYFLMGSWDALPSIIRSCPEYSFSVKICNDTSFSVTFLANADRTVSRFVVSGQNLSIYMNNMYVN